MCQVSSLFSDEIECLRKIFHYCRQLSFYEEPNYDKLRAFVKFELEEMKVDLTKAKFEWQKTKSEGMIVDSP